MGRPKKGAGRGRRDAPPDAGRDEALEAAADARWLEELAALAADPACWDALDEDTLLMLVFQQCLLFAETRAPEAAEALAGLYPKLVERGGAEARFELLLRVGESVERGDSSVLALLPFLQHETDADAVARAGLAFATLAPVAGDDELSGPRMLARMAEHADDEGTAAGLLAAVLQLGDRRLLPLLAEGRRHLAPGALAALASVRADSPMVFAAVVEFWLSALEDGAAAADGALARLAEQADPPCVLDVRRHLPANATGDREPIEILADEPLAVFASRIAPRLRACGAGATAALAAWGIAAEG